MQKTEEKSSRSAEGLYKFFIYFVLILLAVTIIVPVAWVFMASIKQNSEFYGKMCIRDRFGFVQLCWTINPTISR